jgi:hypothetical protein
MAVRLEHDPLPTIMNGVFHEHEQTPDTYLFPFNKHNRPQRILRGRDDVVTNQVLGYPAKVPQSILFR